MISVNLFKVFYNIGHIIYYKGYNIILHLIDIELPIPSHFNTISLMKSPNQIDKNDDDYIDSWYEGDSNGNYIKDDNYKPYNGPVCETP